jgi:hypothetical protein
MTAVYIFFAVFAILVIRLAIEHYTTKVSVVINNDSGFYAGCEASITSPWIYAGLPEVYKVIRSTDTTITLDRNINMEVVA